MNKDKLGPSFILDSGGRGNAIAHALYRAPSHDRDIIVAPGNGGSELFPNSRRMPINLKNPAEIVQAVMDTNASMVIVGQEDPLFADVTDNILTEAQKYKRKVDVVGPIGTIARALEGSKASTAKLLDRYHISQPRYAIFAKGQYDQVMQYLDCLPTDYNGSAVIKASGPALGKGVDVCNTIEEAKSSVRRMMVDKVHGESGETIVIQEKLNGFEMSAIALVDGEHLFIFPDSEDHKQAFDRDRGPNTGGMGVVAPHSNSSAELSLLIKDNVFQRLVNGLNRDGFRYIGFLYAGLIIIDGIPYVIEINDRLGDPETQAILPLLKQNNSMDFNKAIQMAARGRLSQSGYFPVETGVSVAVTLASGGYPGEYEKGKVIYGLDTVTQRQDIDIYQAGTEKREDGTYVTNEGRVLTVVGKGVSTRDASNRAYEVIGPTGIHFDKMHYRTDIGKRRG